MNIYEESLRLHEQLNGKIEVVSRCRVSSKEDLSRVYSPGVAQACKEISNDYVKCFDLTRRGSMVCVATDGSAVLGLGNIGASASMPVMEGKCALFKAFGDVDAFPICIDSQDIDTIVETLALISKSFGGINLEDISAPRCFEIEEKLQEKVDVPVFHDDQHGTAIVVAAALLNALAFAKKTSESVKIVINGCGAAGCAIAELLIDMGFTHLVLCDRFGVIDSKDLRMSEKQRQLALLTDTRFEKGQLADAVKDADVFIGVSRAGLLTKEMVLSMNKPIIFAMANPEPEIMPHDAYAAGACVVGTGRSDFPNQINNVLVFPGIFKGALQVRAKRITENMKIAAVYAIASLIPEEELSRDNIIVSPLHPGVAQAVADAVIAQVSQS